MANAQSTTGATGRTLAVRRLGSVPYGDGLALQESLVAARRAGEVPDTLLLLEHPHVITLGTSTSAVCRRIPLVERLCHVGSAG